MGADYLVILADSLLKKADGEASSNPGNASKSYKRAADKYREAASAIPNRKDELLLKAEECDRKADNPMANVSLRSSSYSDVRSTQNNNPSNGFATNQTHQNNSVNRPNPTNSRNTNNNTMQNKQDSKQDELSNVKVTEPEDLTLEEALGRLNSLIGLESVKQQVATLVSKVRMNKRRIDNGMPPLEDFSYHLCFSGNPGTGKTTVARLMAQIYKSLGILERGQTVEASKTDLVSNHVGETPMKTQEVIDKAMDGVLFIDEAYMLTNDNSEKWGQQAVDTLLKQMEDNKDRLVVIVAGYTKEMEDFVASNPGLKSRFNNVIQFDDYTDEEMMKIFESICQKNLLTLTDNAKIMLNDYFKKLYKNRDRFFGNGRTVRVTYQSIALAQFARLDEFFMNNLNVSPEEEKRLLSIITESDVAKATNMVADNSLIEYQKVREENSRAKIFELLSVNDMNTIATKLCTRLEATLRYKFKLEGTLDDMLRRMKSLTGDLQLNLSKADFDCLHHIRMYRNAVVHSNPIEQPLNPADVMNCLTILEKIDNK